MRQALETRTPDLLGHSVSHTLKNIKFNRNSEIKTDFFFYRETRIANK